VVVIYLWVDLSLIYRFLSSLCWIFDRFLVRGKLRRARLPR
jgi:hypothetical protein